MASHRCNYCKKRLGLISLVCSYCGTRLPHRIKMAVGLTIWLVVIMWFGIIAWIVVRG